MNKILCFLLFYVLYVVLATRREVTLHLTESGIGAESWQQSDTRLINWPNDFYGQEVGRFSWDNGRLARRWCTQPLGSVTIKSRVVRAKRDSTSYREPAAAPISVTGPSPLQNFSYEPSTPIHVAPLTPLHTPTRCLTICSTPIVLRPFHTTRVLLEARVGQISCGLSTSSTS